MRRAPILLVDDEPQNLAALRQILEGEHALVYARNGAEALAAAAKHRPALILLDIEMPDLNGLAVCAQLKARAASADTPVIFVTAREGIVNEVAGFASGAVDYITKPYSPAVIRARVRTHLSLVRVSQLERSQRDAIYMLGEAGHFSDADTGVHIWRMASYAGLLAGGAGWDEEDCRMLELAAPMHDTGKLGIPGGILRKPGPLDAAEWEVMRRHARIGHEILRQSDAPVFQLAAEVALNHHEKWDGGGYPGGLAGPAIPESARIVAVADVFDALAMRRPYKDPWPTDRIVDAIRAGAGSHFEPRMIEVFDAALPRMLELKAGWDAREARGFSVASVEGEGLLQ